MDANMGAKQFSQSLLALLHTQTSSDSALGSGLDVNSSPKERADFQVAYLSTLRKVNLDYSQASLVRLDRLLDGVKNKTQPTYSDFIENQAKLNFVFLLAFYLGETASRLSQQPVSWLDQQSAASQGIVLTKGLTERYAANFDGLLMKPVMQVLNKLFRAPVQSCVDYMADFLKQLKLHELEKPINPDDIWQDRKTDKKADAALKAGRAGQSHLQPASTVPSAHEVGKNNPQVKHNVGSHGGLRDSFGHTPNSPNQTTQKNAPQHNQNAPVQSVPAQAPQAFDHQPSYQPNYQPSQPNQQPNQQSSYQPNYQSSNQPKSQTGQKQGQVTQKQSYEEKLGIRYNSNIIASFKPPLKWSMIFSILPALFSLYIVKRMIFNNGVDMAHIICLLVFLLLLAGIWVNYFVSHIGVYDTKVSVFSLFGSKDTHFDIRTRFYHIQSDGQFMGTSRRVLIKTNADRISLQAQQQSKLEDALLQVEEALLVPRLLERLKQGETVGFELAELNLNTITYGAKSAPVSSIVDYKMTNNDLKLITDSGALFARLDMKSTPNVHTLITLIEHIKQG